MSPSLCCRRCVRSRPVDSPELSWSRPFPLSCIQCSRPPTLQSCPGIGRPLSTCRVEAVVFPEPFLEPAAVISRVRYSMAVVFRAVLGLVAI
jgi:hypothetical protein